MIIVKCRDYNKVYVDNFVTFKHVNIFYKHFIDNIWEGILYLNRKNQ